MQEIKRKGRFARKVITSFFDYGWWNLCDFPERTWDVDKEQVTKSLTLSISSKVPLS